MARSIVTFFVAALFIAIGTGFAYYKWSYYQFPITPTDSFKSWYVELSTTLNRKGHGTAEALELSVIKPRDRASLAVASPQLLARDFGISESRSTYRLSMRQPGKRESFLLRFSLYELDVNEGRSPASKKNYRGAYHPSNRLSNPDDSTLLFYEEIDRIGAEAKARSSSPISFTRQLIQLLQEEKGTAKLLRENMNAVDTASVVVALLEANDLRARPANGFRLTQVNGSAPLERWVEVWYRGEWKRFFVDKKADQQEGRFFAWWYGDVPLINVPSDYTVRTTLSYKANNDGAFTRSLWLSEKHDSLAYHVALQTLPLQQQLVLQILLLLPLGALIVSIFRQMIGIQTFGTFMPVLVALALRETGLFYGIIFFFSIVLTGLLARFYVGRLQLLMVPRLSAVLSIVVLVIVCFMLLNKEQAIPLGISVALFPVIIIVMFIERMSTMMDEQGARAAYIGCINSLFIACVVYLCIMHEAVQHLVFTFPEHLLIVLGLCMLLGRYNGFKLTEYIRFWQLQRRIRQNEAAGK